MEFLRELLNTNEAFVPDFEDMTDSQLVDLCAELDMEDTCELDDDGRIMNRDMVIADLKAGHGPAPDFPEMDSPDDEMVRRPTPAVTSLESVTESKKNIKEVAVIKHRGKKMTNTRKDFNFYKPVEESKKLPSPTYGGKQGNVSNKSAVKAVDDKIGNAGLKGMKKKDRPYMEKPRFRDWLGGNMFWTMTKSGDLAGTMKLGEGEEKEYEVFGYYESRQDGKNYRRKFKASSPEEAKEKALKNLHGMAARKENRISKKSIKIKDVREVK